MRAFMSVVVAVLATALASPVAFAAEAVVGPAPTFADYPATHCKIGPLKDLDFSNPKDNIYAPLSLSVEEKEMIRESMKQGVNFACHYTVVAWRPGCGLDCISAVFVDRSTGLIRGFPYFGTVSGAVFHKDSALVVSDCDLSSFAGLGVPAWAVTEYFVFDEKTKRFSTTPILVDREAKNKCPT